MKPLAPVMAMRMTKAKGGGAQDGHNAHGLVRRLPPVDGPRSLHPTGVSGQLSGIAPDAGWRGIGINRLAASRIMSYYQGLTTKFPYIRSDR